MAPLGLVGSLAIDLVEGAPPRPGGAVYYAAHALRALGRDAVIVTKCSREDRSELLPSLTALDFPVEWRPAATTTTFDFSYDGDARRMAVRAVGDPWTPNEMRGALAGARWVHVGALLRSDFPGRTVAELARGRIVSLDGHALVRPARVGPLELSGELVPEVLEHVSILKLSEHEAGTLLGKIDEESLGALGVPEVVVTFGSRGSLVFAGGRSETIGVEPVAGADPTGAGDAFAAAYLAARSSEASPADSARQASKLVSRLLSARVR